MRRLTIFAKLGALFSLSIGLAFCVMQPAFALSGSDWHAGRIIDDSVFYNKSSMSVEQIQQFLNAKVPSCDNWGTKPYAGTTRRAYSEARGVSFPLTCLKDYHENTTTKQNNLEGRPIPAGAKSAANIIWDAAQEFNINPQVIIVLLQKEQNLILDDWPWPIQYRSATGYGCPDSAPCDSQYYGFYNQVQNATRQFRRYASFPNDYNHVAGRNNSIRWSPNSSCGSSTVFIENTATASLYNYTPYQPNQAALNNLYGTGDGCSAYGNRNFWRDFNSWFGTSTGDGFILAISDDPNDLRQWILYGSIKQYVPDAQTKRAWGLLDWPLTTMSAATLSSISTGPPLDRLMSHQTGGHVYFLDQGKRYKIPWDSVYDSWNLRGRTISSVSTGLWNMTTDGGEMSFAVKDPTSSTIYMPDGKNSNGQTVLRPFANDTVRYAWSGMNAPYMTVSMDYWDDINDAIGSTISHSKITYNGQEFLATNGYRLPLPSLVAPLYPGTALSVSNATIARLGTTTIQVTPLIRSVSSSSVYLVDNGVRHQLATGDHVVAWTSYGQSVRTLNDAMVDSIPLGSPINSYYAENAGQLYVIDGSRIPVPANLDTAYRQAGPVYAASNALTSLFIRNAEPATGIVKARGATAAYLLDNSGKRRHLERGEYVAAWGGLIREYSPAIVNAITPAAAPKVYVSDGTNEFVVDSGKKLSVDSTVKTNWDLSNPTSFSDGTLARLNTAGALESEFRAGNGYYIVRNGSSYGTTDIILAQAWNIQGAPMRNEGLIGLVQNKALTRYVRSNNDNRTFLVDSGQWYNVPTQQYANLKVDTQPTMTLSPSLAPNTITDFVGPIVKTTRGEYYVIDNGGRRYFPNKTIEDHWTNGGSAQAQTVSVGFVISLPVKGHIERAVKGSSVTIYSAQNRTKRPITSPHTYVQSYAPYIDVSDQLLGSLPDGSPL